MPTADPNHPIHWVKPTRAGKAECLTLGTKVPSDDSCLGALKVQQVYCSSRSTVQSLIFQPFCLSSARQVSYLMRGSAGVPS